MSFVTDCREDKLECLSLVFFQAGPIFGTVCPVFFKLSVILANESTSVE